MIRITKYSDLDPGTRSLLDGFIEAEFGHIPIVRETEWEVPDWTLIHYAGEDISTFYNVIEREVSLDGRRLKVAGINNVITPPAFRGQGYSSRTLRDTEAHLFKVLGCDLGLLLCADALIPFYERLGWYTVDCPVYFQQSDGRKLWTANTMLLSPGSRFSPGEIDLNGLPW